MLRGKVRPQYYGEIVRKPKARWWIWQASYAWATACSFILGSTFFLVGSTSRIFQDVSDDKHATRTYVLAPYFIGSLCFTTGCFLPLPRVVSHTSWSIKHARGKLRSRNEREVEKAKLQSYFAKVDLLGAILAICGGLMINSATGIDLYLGSKAELIFTSDSGSLWIITAPTMSGRALFMIGGWFTWTARNRSWSLRVFQASKHFWWTTIFFWVGTGLFYAGWFCTDCPMQPYPDMLVKNWCGVSLGYMLGSLFLIAASYIMMLELIESNEGVPRQDEIEIPLLKT